MYDEPPGHAKPNPSSVSTKPGQPPRGCPGTAKKKRKEKKTPKRRHLQQYKARPNAPVVRAIPAGYEDDSRDIRDLIADGLPVTAEYITLYEKLEDGLRKAEILSAALGRLHMSHH